MHALYRLEHDIVMSASTKTMLTEQQRLRCSCDDRELVVNKKMLLKQVCKPGAVLEVHFKIIVYTN